MTNFHSDKERILSEQCDREVKSNLRKLRTMKKKTIEPLKEYHLQNDLFSGMRELHKKQCEIIAHINKEA